MSTAIKIENLSKSYFLSHKSKERFPTLRDALVVKAGEYGLRLLHPFKSSTQPMAGSAALEEFWALKDVSFEVQQGDRIGIIGRNGAGKSTLLKILSRITEPTAGKVSIKGRVASLLEVGTGFHPELTGRENIYLNGAILGMGKQEIKRKFDEIVDFAEVEKFLDTPVKRYSSGMYVRLAFAVAAHLEPEIFVIDEVLAVGDSSFQRKCIAKMNEAGSGGRTVLFVSHNVGQVKALCERGILLNSGKLVLDGNVVDAIGFYNEQSFGHVPLLDRVDRKGSGEILLEDCQPLDESMVVSDTFPCGSDLFIKVKFRNSGELDYNDITCSIAINDIAGQRISLVRHTFSLRDGLLEKGEVVCRLIDQNLNLGRYYFNLSIYSADKLLDWVEFANYINIVSHGSELLKFLPGKDRSVVFKNEWSC